MKKVSGFSLIELMITVAIIGIIAAIAIPAYQSQIVSSRRGDVKSQLLQLQLSQESHRLRNSTYASAIELPLPNNDYYDFTVTNNTATTYTITATAKVNESQQADTACRVININQSMDKTPAACW